MRCMPPRSRGTSIACGSPASSSIRSPSISKLITNALPVCRWQFRQWQQWTNIGSDMSRYRTSPQAHPPSLRPGKAALPVRLVVGDLLAVPGELSAATPAGAHLEQVAIRDVDEPGAVRGPARARAELRQDVTVAAVGVHHGDLAAERERDPAAVGRPRRPLRGRL